METYFENTNVLSENMMCEVNKKLTVINKIFPIAGILFVAFSLFDFVKSLWVDYVLDLGILISIMIWLVVIVMGLSVPKAAARKMMQQMRLKSRGQPVVQRRHFGEQIVSYTPGNVSTYDYDQIEKIYSLKSSYTLIFAKNSGTLILSREGFTKGTFSEFKQFLRYKRPDLKIPE